MVLFDLKHGPELEHRPQEGRPQQEDSAHTDSSSIAEEFMRTAWVSQEGATKKTETQDPVLDLALNSTVRLFGTLQSTEEHRLFIVQEHVNFSIQSFKELPGDGRNTLAIYRPDTRVVLLDRDDFEARALSLRDAGYSAEEVADTLARHLLPIVAHEIQHGIIDSRMKREIGFVYPFSTREEEKICCVEESRIKHELVSKFRASYEDPRLPALFRDHHDADSWERHGPGPVLINAEITYSHKDSVTNSTAGQLLSRLRSSQAELFDIIDGPGMRERGATHPSLEATENWRRRNPDYVWLYDGYKEAIAIASDADRLGKLQQFFAPYFAAYQHDGLPASDYPLTEALARHTAAVARLQLDYIGAAVRNGNPGSVILNFAFAAEEMVKLDDRRMQSLRGSLDEIAPAVVPLLIAEAKDPLFAKTFASHLDATRQILGFSTLSELEAAYGKK